MMAGSTLHNIRYRFSKGMAILFVGINPHPGSDARAVPFSNNKMFWYLLSDAGVIEETRTYLKDDKNLKEFYDEKFSQKYRLGFINLVDRLTHDVSQLRRGEEKRGVKRAVRVIRECGPKTVIFVGKVTYQKFFDLRHTDYGWKEDMFASKVYVMHFPIRGAASVRIKELREVVARVHQWGAL